MRNRLSWPPIGVVVPVTTGTWGEPGDDPLTDTTAAQQTGSGVATTEPAP